MKISGKIAVTAKFVLILTALVLAGCAAGQQMISESKGVNQTASQSTTPPGPVNQSAKTDRPEVKTLPAPKPELGVPAAEAKTADNKEKVVYLTFDDGPNSHFTGRVLDVLARKNAKATFMVVGKNVILNPDVIRRIISEGHGISNHSFSHDYNKIYVSPEAFIADLEENNVVLAPYTGKPVMVFRAPGGPQKLSPALRNKLHRGGYTSVGWNIASADSDPNGITRKQLYDNIVNGLEIVESMNRTPIVLMHDGTQLTTTEARPGSATAAYIQSREAVVAALPSVIDHFKAKGYSFGVVDQHTPPAW